MKKLITICVIVVVLLCSISYGAVVTGSWNLGGSDLGIWQEYFDGGGEGQPWNNLAAGGEHWSLGGTLQGVTELQTNVYQTIYTAAYLYLNYNGPWWGIENAGIYGYASEPFGDITVITTKTYDGDTLTNLAFEVSASGYVNKYRLGSGSSEYPELVSVSIAGGYSGMPDFDDSLGYIWMMGDDLDWVSVTIVPEPATMCLLSLGGLLLRRKK